MSCHERLGRMLSRFASRRCPKSKACTPSSCPSGAAAAAAIPGITKKLCSKGVKVVQNLCWEWPGVNQHWLRGLVAGSVPPETSSTSTNPPPRIYALEKERAQGVTVSTNIVTTSSTSALALSRRYFAAPARAAAPNATQGTKTQNHWRGAHYIRQRRRRTEGSCCTAATATVN